MKTRYEQNIKILSSMTDAKAQVGLTFALSYLQDNMSEYFRNLGCDGLTMIPIANCFWVMTKTKVKFNKTIKWMDNVTLATDLSKKSAYRLNILNHIFNSEGTLAIEGVQEICAISNEDRKLIPISATIFPTDIDIDESTIPSLSFTKFDEELDDSCLVKEHLIDSRGIDFFGHTNNVEYARLMLSTLSLNDLNKIAPKQFEIHYISESREGQSLQIYRKVMDHAYYFEIKDGERVVCKSLYEYDIIL